MGKAITTLAPWYGSSRTMAHRVGELLEGCNWVGVPFAGGMGELLHIRARTLLVSDLHRHVLNLARVVANEKLNAELRSRLADVPLHEDVLANSQDQCRMREAIEQLGEDRNDPSPVAADVDWAFHYFIAAWMTRNGKAGTRSEFDGGLSVRWDGGGGDSALRFRNATAALAEWQATMRRCTFVRMDAFDFLAKVKDQAGCGVYCDPPWFLDGDQYTHRFGNEQQRQLASRLSGFGSTRVVVRFGDHPTVRALYPASAWTWHEFSGRTAANKKKAEVLLVNKLRGEEG